MSINYLELLGTRFCAPDEKIILFCAVKLAKKQTKPIDIDHVINYYNALCDKYKIVPMPHQYIRHAISSLSLTGVLKVKNDKITHVGFQGCKLEETEEALYKDHDIEVFRNYSD